MKSAHPDSLSYMLAQELARGDSEDRGTVAELAQLAEDLDLAVELCSLLLSGFNVAHTHSP